MSEKSKVRINDAINAFNVRLILDGRNMGVVPKRDALNLARERGLDLVEMSSNGDVPVCQIIDYGKFCYEQKKKKKANKQKIVDWKGIRFTPGIDKHDIETKVKQLKSFLQQGKPVRLMVKFRKRQLAHTSEGEKVLNEVLDQLGDAGKVESRPKMEGQQMVVQVYPKV